VSPSTLTVAYDKAKDSPTRNATVLWLKTSMVPLLAVNERLKSR